jgi:hypothetical protein
MCLSTASRAIGEDCRIVPVQHAVQQRLGGRLVYIALCGSLVEDSVECKCLVLDALPLRTNSGPCEAVYRSVFWGIKDTGASQLLLGVSMARVHLQALVVQNLDDGLDALGAELRHRCRSQRAVS